MSKTLVRGLIVAVAFFHSGFLQAQSLVVPLSPRQAAAFCSANGTAGQTNIDLRMPNDVHLIGMVDCTPSAIAGIHRVEFDPAPETRPAPPSGVGQLELTTLTNRGR